MRTNLQELRSKDESRKDGMGGVDVIASKITSEIDSILVASTSGLLVQTKRKVNACSVMEMWFFPKTQNLAGGQTFTINFYKYLDGVPVIGESITVTTPAVTAAECGKVDVETVDAEIESYDSYDVTGTVTVVDGGTVEVQMAKKTKGGSGEVNIEGVTLVDGNLPVLEGAYEISSVPAAAAVTAASSAVTLTKAEILNDGVHTIFYRDNGGAADVDDTPLYPGERIGPLTGTIRVICAAAETSTLRITEFV